jgi:hypothetical protein
VVLAHYFGNLINGVNMTLGDRIDNFLNSWIRKAEKEPEPEEKPDTVFKDDEWFNVEKFEKFEPKVEGEKLTSKNCRKLALTCPLFMKGVKKKAMDTFRAGFKEEKLDGTKPKTYEQIWIDDFNRRNEINSLLEETKQCAHIYGEGVWYIRFKSELSKEYSKSSAPPEHDLPFKVYLLDPERVDKYIYKNSYWRDKNIKHLKYKVGRDTIYIHPDRIISFQEKKLPFSDFGISDVTILRHIISSVADIDIAVGHILKWFAHGFIWWQKEGASPEERKQMLKTLSQHPNALVGDERYTLEVKNPEAINPKPFYDYLVMCIAGILVMPTHILTGVRVGRVTGAEAGYSDYYRDINDIQRLIYAPRLKKLYQMIFDYHTHHDRNALARNVEYIFDYDIVWNPTYVNEMAEAELFAKRAEAVEKLISTKLSFPVISIDEAREILMRGQIEFKNKLPQKEQVKFKKPSEEERRAIKAMIETKKKIDAGVVLSSGEKEELAEAFRLKHTGDP